MIQSIHITNFQSHKDTHLDLSPGVNVIVGSSDSGKTAIIRALRWLRWNRPTGDAFRSTWGGDTFVGVETDHHYVDRIKGKDNRYELDTSYVTDPNSKKIFEAFGTDVPEDIIKILNLDETNLQMQLDSPFLLSASAGEVAAYFNRIAHLDQIDSGLKNIQSWIRSLEGTIKHLQGEKKTTQQQYDAFAYLDKAEIDLDVLEQMQSQQDQRYGDLRWLEGKIQAVEAVNQEIEEAQWVVDFEPQVDALLGMYQQKEQVGDTVSELGRLCTQITRCDTEIQEFQERQKLETPVDTLLGMYAGLKQSKERHQALYSLTEQIVDEENAILDTRLEVRDMEETFHQYMPEICPLCETNLKGK